MKLIVTISYTYDSLGRYTGINNGLERLSMKYVDFIAWVLQGNTNEFYKTMRWDTWREDCKKMELLRKGT